MTMTPNKFKLNSDYLSLAQVSSRQYTAYVGGGVLTPSGQSGSSTEQNFDFAIPSQAGAIDNIMISKDGGSFRICQYIRLDFTTMNPYQRVMGSVDVSRTSASNLRLKLILENVSGNVSATYPSMTFTIKVSSFKPPNVF